MLAQLHLLGKYNQLMNQRQYDAVAKLTNKQIQDDVGVFFKSILGTLNHTMVGDIIWLQRFSIHPSGCNALSYLSNLDRPKSLNTILFQDLDCLSHEREKIDNIIIQWVCSLSETDLKSNISYRNMKGEVFNKPLLSLIYHLFMHQTHHRGQVTALLSQYHIDFGETDLIEIIEDV